MAIGIAYCEVLIIVHAGSVDMINLMLTKMFLAVLGTGIFLHTLIMADEGTNTPLKIINYGYNHFVPNSHSGTLAVIPYDTEEGMAVFANSQYKKAFFKLSPHYTPQQHLASCGIASAVIILNAIYANSCKTPPISKRGSWYYSESRILYGHFIWTEGNFYHPKISQLFEQKVLEGEEKINGLYEMGTNLDKLTHALNVHGAKAAAHHVIAADEAAIDQFRDLVKSRAANPIEYIIANYNLDVYVALSVGHFSPIAAYDEASDSLLILDTWSASNTWVWVKLADFYKSMNTLDGKNYRGYILVQAKIG